MVSLVRRSLLALSLISILALTQRAYSIEVSAPGTCNVNNCSASNSDFEAGLKQLAETVTDRTDIPSEFLQRYFAGCTIEKAREFLAKNGFDAEEQDPTSNYSERQMGTRRLVLAEKNIRPLKPPAASLNCRFILRVVQSDALSIQAFFYFDAP